MILRFYGFCWEQYCVRKSNFPILPDGYEYEAVFLFKERLPVHVVEGMRRNFRREILEMQVGNEWGYHFFVPLSAYGKFLSVSKEA